VGAAVVVVGIVGFAAILSPAVPIVVGMLTWAVAGLGMGFAYSPLSLVVLREAPEETQGFATAGLQLSDVMGTALGTGVGGAIIALGHRSAAEDWVGLAGAFAVAAAVGLVALVLSGRLAGPGDATLEPELAPASPRRGQAAGHPASHEPVGFERSEPTR
jgi:MFS family permease